MDHVNLTEKEFLQHVGSAFLLKLDQLDVSLKLTEVKGSLPHENEQAGMERFSVFFDGPGNIILPQQTCRLEHDQMGEIYLFLVPVSAFFFRTRS